MIKKIILVCLISIMFPIAVWGGLIDNGDGTVTDTDTGLMWQKDTALGTYTWEQALSYCESSTLAGYNDWRLPNRNELQSIVDYSRYNPSIDPIFSNTVSSSYWSSTTNAGYPGLAWFVFFGYGDVNGYEKSGYYYVRAVRAGQCGGFGDSDGDGIPDDGDNSGTPGDNPCTGGEIENCDDNCPNDSNPLQEDGDSDVVGDVCDNCPDTPNGDQLDTRPPGGNDCGDACECEADLDGDGTVGGFDTNIYKTDYPRNPWNHPCTNLDPCIGDLDCDGTVGGFDTNIYKTDYPRNPWNNPCPDCSRNSGFPCTY